MSIRSVWLTAKWTSLLTYCLNPFASAVSVYVPSEMRLKRYPPSGPDLTLRSSPVDRLFNVSVTFGTIAPLGSVTVPKTLPPWVWPNTVPTDKNHNPIKALICLTLGSALENLIDSPRSMELLIRHPPELISAVFDADILPALL